MGEWKRAGDFGGRKGRKGGFKSDFKRGSFGKPRFGGGGGFSKGGDRGGAREDREMFDAVCSNCGKDCQVPFKPNGKTPIFCNNCFAENKGESDGGRDFRRDDRRGERRDDRRDFRRDKPSFDTRTSFKDGRPDRRPGAAPDPRIDTLISEMQQIGTKLDALIEIMSAPKKPATKTKKKKAADSE